MVAGVKKGKQCPGGYWIPRNKQCGKPGPKMPGPKMAGAKRLRTGGAARPSGGMGRKALLAAGIAGGVGLYAKSRHDIRKQRQQIAERNAAQAAKKQAMATTQTKKPSAPKPRDAVIEKNEQARAETNEALSKLEKDFAETRARMKAAGYDLPEPGKVKEKKDSRAVFDACEGIREKARFDAICRRGRL